MSIEGEVRALKDKLDSWYTVYLCDYGWTDETKDRLIELLKLTNLKPELIEKEVAKIIEDKIWERHEGCPIGDGYKECPEECCYLNAAKDICSHFSKPIFDINSKKFIKYPEKKEVINIKKKMCFDDFQHPRECLYDLPYDKSNTCRLQDKGIPKEQCKEYKDMQVEYEDFIQYNQAISDMRRLNGEGGV